MTRGLAYVLDDARVDSWRDDVPSQSIRPRDIGMSESEIGFASKLAGRRNAAAIPQSEVDELYARRKCLLDKKFFNNDFSPADRRQLALVRWKIDCVIDARHGAHIDRLENAIQAYQKIASDANFLKEELMNSTMNKRQEIDNDRKQIRR